MVDVLRVADVLVRHALARHAAEVDLIGYYGSHARGDAQPGSDLDIFFIPADGTRPPLARAFRLEGVLFDFWAISWSQMEAFATGRSRGWAFAPGIVQQTVVLHARNESLAERFRVLQERVRELQTQAAFPEMLQRALQACAALNEPLARMRAAAAAAARSEVRSCAWQLISGTLECLALVNQTPFRKGLPSSLAEIESLVRRPDALPGLVRRMATSSDVQLTLEASEQLVAEVEDLLCTTRADLPSVLPLAPRLERSYPEIKDRLMRLMRACEQGDDFAAGADAWLLQSDVMALVGTRYRALGLPDLMEASFGDLTRLAQQARLFDARFRSLLEEYAVDLCELQSLDELERWLA